MVVWRTHLRGDAPERQVEMEKETGREGETLLRDAPHACTKHGSHSSSERGDVAITATFSKQLQRESKDSKDNKVKNAVVEVQWK